jgi:hypothetical protein
MKPDVAIGFRHVLEIPREADVDRVDRRFDLGLVNLRLRSQSSSPRMISCLMKPERLGDSRFSAMAASILSINSRDSLNGT